MTITLEGPALPHPVQLTGIGAGTLTVQEPIAAPPCEVDLVVRQGAREQRRRLRLPDGLRADSPQASDPVTDCQNPLGSLRSNTSTSPAKVQTTTNTDSGRFQPVGPGR